MPRASLVLALAIVCVPAFHPDTVTPCLAQPPPKTTEPKLFRPDAPTLKQIIEKTDRLRAAIDALRAARTPDDVLIEVAISLKAAENITRFDEWLAANSVKWCLTTLDEGLKRAEQVRTGRAAWREVTGQRVVRAYRSQVDGSIQPYAVLLPRDFGRDPKKKWRLDLVLHGRDATLTEAKFLATPAATAPPEQDFIQLEVYGRGNNAYRWAGETDVWEALAAFRSSYASDPVDPDRIVLRGYSMGGAGTWHIGLHHPCRFAVLGPGAGFVTTHGYVAHLPAQLPEYQEKCLRIYDALVYAENAFHVPVVAYNGSDDPQKKSADLIESALKGFPEPVRFSHLVAPGLGHQFPPEWQAKALAEYRRYAGPGRDPNPRRVRFVTYTPRYGRCAWVEVRALERMYEKAVVDATRTDSGFVVRTQNVRELLLHRAPAAKTEPRVTIDGQDVPIGASGGPSAGPERPSPPAGLLFGKVGDRWAQRHPDDRFPPPKRAGLQGPIDDAFLDRFVVVGPEQPDGYPTLAWKRFADLWERYFRGTLPVITAADYKPRDSGHLVLFGTPRSNPLIRRVLPGLPVTWTEDRLVVDGVEYDARTHLPVLVYPNPLDPAHYVVINSGPTFGEADLKGSNALLFPRLGDWAVIRPTPTELNLAAIEVVAAGLFDENWQFPGKQ